MTGAESTFGPRARRLAIISGWAVIAIGLLALAGWITDSTLLTRIGADLPSIKALTAVGVIALGAALVLRAPAVRARSRDRAGVACATFAAALGTAVIAEYLFGGLGIDELRFDQAGADPGRPSAHTALGLLLCGLALATLDLGSPRHRAALALELLAAIVALAALMGLAYDVDYVQGRAGAAGVALQTAVALGLTVVGIALARPDRGIVAFVSGDDPASVLCRRLAPAAILLPPILAGVGLAGENAGLFTAEVGVAIGTLGGILIIAAAIAVSARHLRAQATEQRAADQKLAESARHFELINDLVATCGFDGYFVQLNGAWEQTLGWTTEELLREPYIEIVHPDDRGAVEDEVAKLAGGGTTAEFKIRIATKAGGWRWTEWSGSPDLAGARFHCVGREISERMKVERALAAERRQLADAQQIASVGSWDLELASGRRTWSEQQYRNHGFDPQGPLPSFEQALARVHENDRDTVAEAMRKIYGAPARFAFSYRVVLPDGQARVIEVEGRPFLDSNGTKRLLGTSRDVTAERDAERLKDDFFGLISHELRTPLTSIIGYTELLAEVEAANLSPRGRHFIEVIERNSRRELGLVGDLLLLTTITAGTFEIEVERVDLAELIRAALDEAAPAAGKAGVEIALDLERAPAIEGDAHRLGQVLANLISNAIKFTPRGGRIAIRATAEGDSGVIVVTDTGIGIPPEHCDRLFERMYRAPEAERRHIQGTGLGLTIVKAIVDAHGGSIAVESKPGRGTSFRIELPGLRVTTPAIAPARAAHGSAR